MVSDMDLFHPFSVFHCYWIMAHKVPGFQLGSPKPGAHAPLTLSFLPWLMLIMSVH